jgi:hypothetical protein
MRTLATSLVIAIAACGDGDGDSPDAPPDAREYEPSCHLAREHVRCEGGVARSMIEWEGGGSSSSLCRKPPESHTAECATGCAIDGAVRLDYGAPEFLGDIFADPSSLCAGAPEAKAGDACGPTAPCLPTRAQLRDDGTVTGQAYLTCGGGLCAPADAPVVERYLQPCDAEILATYGGPGVVGVAGDPQRDRAACLLAWDDQAQALTSGVTVTCIGDWQCPAASLCDHRLTFLSTRRVAVFGVCKPGPRGALTPAMLSP